MAGKVFFAALERKYAQLLGELAVMEREVEPLMGVAAIAEATECLDRRREQMEGSLAHLEAVCRLFDPSRTLRRVRAVRPVEKKNPAGGGGIAHAALAILREAPAPMSAREMMREIIRLRGRERPSEKEADRIVVSVLDAMRRHEGHGVVVKYPGKPARWSLTPPSATALTQERDRPRTSASYSAAPRPIAPTAASILSIGARSAGG